MERPAPPFTTSTLTQEASRKLGFSTERTMQVAQRLFQGVDVGNGQMEGLITYHRTDSTTLSDKAINESARVIREMFGGEYYDGPRRYQTRVKNAQEAHEAIRPTDFRLAPSQLEGALDPDEVRVYELIWKRTMASQMVDARVLRTTLEISAKVLTARPRRSPQAAKRSSLPASAAPTLKAATIPRRSSRNRKRSCRSAASAIGFTAMVRGHADHARGHRAEAARNVASRAVHGSVADQGARAARHRPAFHVSRRRSRRSSAAVTSSGRPRRSCPASQPSP